MNKKHFYAAVILASLLVAGLLPVLAQLPPELKVAIDIKPGSDDNVVNLGSNGVVPVSILSGDLSDGTFFDATLVEPDSIQLAGATVAIRGQGTNYLITERDVNGDGLIDLEVKVDTENLTPNEEQDGYAQLFCKIGAVTYWGEGNITVVPPQ
ncbi:MAG: hypothetical protein ACYTBX_09170 [Planctomycetota bacterium]